MGRLWIIGNETYKEVYRKKVDVDIEVNKKKLGLVGRENEGEEEIGYSIDNIN